MINQLEKYQMPARWHEFAPGVRFLVRLAPMVSLVDAGGSTFSAESYSLGTIKEIFEYCLLRWEGIESNGSAQEVRRALYKNDKVLEFIIHKATGRKIKIKEKL